VTLWREAEAHLFLQVPGKDVRFVEEGDVTFPSGEGREAPGEETERGLFRRSKQHPALIGTELHLTLLLYQAYIPNKALENNRMSVEILGKNFRTGKIHFNTVT
jgi:hypothetical protein